MILNETEINVLNIITRDDIDINYFKIIRLEDGVIEFIDGPLLYLTTENIKIVVDIIKRIINKENIKTTIDDILIIKFKPIDIYTDVKCVGYRETPPDIIVPVINTIEDSNNNRIYEYCIVKIKMFDWDSIVDDLIESPAGRSDSYNGIIS